MTGEIGSRLPDEDHHGSDSPLSFKNPNSALNPEREGADGNGVAAPFGMSSESMHMFDMTLGLAENPSSDGGRNSECCGSASGGAHFKEE